GGGRPAPRPCLHPCRYARGCRLRRAVHAQSETKMSDAPAAVPAPPARPASPGLFDRALRRIGRVWREMAASVVSETDDSIEAQIRACLNGHGGEVSARSRAARL